ncbi:MAG: hypothetical protein AB1486_10020 [Planctomycetota bacterium]
MNSFETRCGAALGLLAFGVAYIVSLLCGAAMLEALARAVLALLALFASGCLIGFGCRHVFEDVLRAIHEPAHEEEAS